MTFDRLVKAAQSLDEAQIELLGEMAEAFRWDVSTWYNPNSDLVHNGFGESLLNRLRLHHATSEEKFNKTSFEFAFKAAARFAGRNALKTTSSTFQGADVVVDGVRWSLKTEGAANMSTSAITISKFSEARWIRDCTNEVDFAWETAARIGKHLSEYDRVITLRGRYVNNNQAVLYDLVEIPHEMLQSATTLDAAAFSPRTSAGSSTAQVFWRNHHAFTVVLDGSVEKVTLRNIQVSQCLSHARWTVPVLPLEVS